MLFDSGVRGGADVVKALALGATAVGIGRPYAWALAVGGADGIAHVLRCLLAETDLTMASTATPGSPISRPTRCSYDTSGAHRARSRRPDINQGG